MHREHELVAGQRLVRSVGADHTREQTLRPAQLAAVEDPLRRPGGAARDQADHRLGQLLAAPEGEVDGHDRLVLERVDLRHQALAPAGGGEQRSGVVGRRGHHHVGPGLAARVALEAVAAGHPLDGLDRVAGAQLAAAHADVARGGHRKELGQVGARQQQLARGGARGEAVAQHVGEDLGRGFGDRGVERGHAQGLPDQLAQRCRLARLGEQRVDRHRRVGQAEAVPLQPAHQPQHRQAVGPAQTLRSQQADGEVKGRGQRRRLQVQPAGHVQGERQVGELLGRHAGEAQQAGELAVGADEDVLAVVHPPVVVLVHHAGTAAHGVRALEHGDVHPGARELDRAGEPGVAGTDDGDDRHAHARNQVVPASQTLRSGVSEVRRSSTRKPSAAISRSRVR